MKRVLVLVSSLAALLGCNAETPAPAPQAAPALFEPATEAEPRPELPKQAASLRFADRSEAWLPDARHQAGRHEERWIAEIMSGGGALLDLNRDGALDLFLADSGELNPEGHEAASPRLWLGKGDGSFTEVTEAWGLEAHGYAMGVAAGDVDGDGWTDLYLSTFDGKDRLLRNREGQGFEDLTKAWGLEPEGWSTSVAFFDMDADGDLDLYVGRYIDYRLSEAIKCWFRAIHVYCTPNLYDPLPDRLYRNEGGRFVEQPFAPAAPVTKTLAVATGDLDADGDVDLYVAGDTSQNLLWLNDGRGNFEEVGIPHGVAFSKLGREEASMGVAIADSDADGLWDLAVTNFQAEATSLYARRPTGHYRERSDAAGIGASSRARLSFGLEWLDADNDGDEELLVANGHISDKVATYRQSVSFGQKNSLYRNEGSGRFVDVSHDAGTALERAAVSRGLVVGDIDGDGGVDYLVFDNDGPVQVARNETPARGHWISLWLDGPSVGARVEVETAGGMQLREVRGASSYLSVSDRRVHFGLAEATSVESVSIRWPDGREQTLGPLEADRHWRIRADAAPEAYTPGAKVLPP